jgi:hypothetical protein
MTTDEQPPELPSARLRRIRRSKSGPRDGRGPRGPRLPFAVLITALIVGGMALLLVLNTVSAANELRRRGLAIKDASVAAQVQELRNQVAASAAPAKLAVAAAALGMVPANNPAFLIVAADGSVRVMGSPAGARGIPIATVHHKKKKKPAKSSSTSSAAKTTPATSSSSTGRSGRPTSSSPTASTPVPTPTPTPTPTVTLPGGNR